MNIMKTITRALTCLLLTPLASLHAAEPYPPPVALWKDYDPNQGDFKEEIVKVETKDGIFNRDAYISAYVLGEEIRVYCRYRVKMGATKAPGLLVVHGWMGAPEPDKKYVEDGWAVMAHDYCGKTGSRPHFTKYPEKLRHGNMDRTVAGPARAKGLDGKEITDPKQTSDYVWYAIQRRELSYLEQQKEVDRTRLGATGYSYGGTLMWNLATDPRVKAVAAYFGIGYNDYYRDKQVWLYNVPYVEPPKSPGEEIILASIAPEAHVPFITAATLFLNGSNDHHVFGYANITYDTTIVRSTDFNAAIPARLGNAVATDKPSNDLSESGYSAWSNIAELEGPKGIKGFRPTNNERGCGTEQLHDPKWKAPANSRLSFKFYCTEPQTVVLTAADHNSVELEITASDHWQEMTIVPERLINRFNQKPMSAWSSVGKIHFLPKQGSDLAKVIFADFQWVTPDAQKP